MTLPASYIQPEDTLNTGLRAKYNANLDKMIKAASVSASGVLTLLTQDDTALTLDLSPYFYTKAVVDEQLRVSAATINGAGTIAIADVLTALAGLDGLKAITPYTMGQAIRRQTSLVATADESIEVNSPVHYYEGEGGSTQVRKADASARVNAILAADVEQGEEALLQLPGTVLELNEFVVDGLYGPLVPGAIYYLSATTPGALTTSPAGTPVGVGVDPTRLLFDPGSAGDVTTHQHPWFTGLPVPTCVVGRPTGEIQYNLTLYMAEGLSASDLRIVRVVNPVDWATVTWEGLFPTISATFPHVGAELPLLLVENGRDPLHPVQTLVELPVEVLPEMTPFITISLRSEVGLDPPHASESVVMELGAGQNYAAWIEQWDVYYAITTGGHTQLVMGIYWQDDSGYVQRVADRVYDTTGIESGLFQLFSDGLSSDTVPTLDGQPLGQGFYDFTFALYNGDTLLHQTNRLLEFGPPVCDVPPAFSTFFRSDAIYNITNTSLWYDFHSLNVDVQSVACWRKSDNALQWEVEAAPGVPPDETADARQYIEFPHTADGTYLLGIRGKSCSSDYDILEFTIGSIPVVTKYELFNMAGGTYLGLIEPGVTLPHVPNFNIRITTTGPHNAVRAQMNSPSRANGWPKSYVNGLTPPATTTRSEVWLFGPGWSSGGLDPAGVYELDFWVWADRAPDDTTNTYLRKAENIVFSMQTGVITGSVSVDLYRDDTGTKIATVEDGTDYEWPEPWETQFNVSNIPHKGWEILTYYLVDGEYELVIGYGQAEGPSSPTVHTKAYRCFTAGAVQGSSANVLYAWPAPPESPYYPNPEPITYGYYKQVLNLMLDGEVAWTHEIHMGLLEEVVQYAKPYNLLTKTNGAHSMDYITAGRANFVINPDGSLSDTYLSGQVAGGDTYNGTQRQNTVEGVTCNVYYTLNGVGLKDGGGAALDLINRNVGKGDIYIQKYYVKASDFPDITSFEKFWYTLTLGKALDIVEFGATLY